jgi:hypothetical protein
VSIVERLDGVTAAIEGKTCCSLTVKERKIEFDAVLPYQLRQISSL